MNTITPEQLRTRLEAGIATLRRLTDHPLLSEESHVALCRAQWRLTYELERLTANEATRAQRA